MVVYAFISGLWCGFLLGVLWRDHTINKDDDD